MSTRCPHGHESATLDFCDECGTPIDPPPVVSDVTRVTKVTGCPACGHGVQPGDRFCEGCGHDMTLAPPVGRWVAIVVADPEYHARLAPPGIAFPCDPQPARTIELGQDEVSIGRSAGADIDLTAPPEDPAASRVHACLRRQGDGSYAVVDLGSANGTRVNGDQAPIAVRVPVLVASGDRIHVGAWTTITIERIDP